MKKIILLSLIPILVIFFFITKSQGKTQSYYSGDAVNFRDNLYVGSANTGSLEIFKLEDHNLKRIFNLRPHDNRFGRFGDFYDLKFSKENGHLFVYTISNFSLYKYEILDDQHIVLIKKVKNTYWEWYNRVDKFGGNIVTISKRGINIWNKDLQIINTYSAQVLSTSSKLGNPYNFRGANNNYILDVDDNYLKVFSRQDRRQKANILLNYKINPGNRQVYQNLNNDIFVIDDYYAKKFDLNGKLLASFKHLDYAGYDMSASAYNNYVYFSNGVGVVKLKQSNLGLVKYRWTNTLGGARGWAMGLKVVYSNGDKVVVFNNSNILVLDQNLRELAHFKATKTLDPISVENLYLNLDHSIGVPNSKINLNGGGYLPNENLSISFGKLKFSTQADAHGRFLKELLVPELEPGSNNIKVLGLSSGLHYSISFQVK